MPNNDQNECPICNKTLTDYIGRWPVCYLHPRCEICHRYTFKEICRVCRFTSENQILECKICKRYTTYNICSVCKKKKIIINK